MNWCLLSEVSNAAFLWLGEERAVKLAASGGMENGESTRDDQDIELLNRIARRDREAFSRFYDHFGGVLFSVATAILKDAGQAEDVLQDVFLQIWERASAYDRQRGKPLSWMIALTRNKAIDRLRSSQRSNRLLAEATQEAAHDLVSVDNAAGDAIGNETALLVRSALKNLAPEQRQAIELAFFGGLTQTEIALELKQPLGTIKARIRRGMLHLRDALKGRL
jgi:RNA polymerase sigma-70 factor (ECF subfamily)